MADKPLSQIAAEKTILMFFAARPAVAVPISVLAAASEIFQHCTLPEEVVKQAASTLVRAGRLRSRADARGRLYELPDSSLFPAIEASSALHKIVGL
jgi:DNA-binding transcriptional regulator PaaX